MPLRPQRVGQRRRVVADARQHEVRAAFPVLKAVTPAERVEPLARLAHLADVPAEILAVGQRRPQRGGRRDVQAVGRDHRLERVERLRHRHERAGAEGGQSLRLREGAGRRRRWAASPSSGSDRVAAEVVVRLVHEDERLRRQRARDRPDGVVADADARRVVRARDEDQPRPRRDGAPASPSSGNVKSARGATVTTRPPTASTVIAYMSNAGRITRLSASRRRPAAASGAMTAASRMPSSRPLVSSTDDSGTPRYAAVSR